MALVDRLDLSTADLLSPNHNIQFTGRLAHKVSMNVDDVLTKYTNDAFCYEHISDMRLRWQYDLFCSDSPWHLSEYNPPFYELNPDTSRPFANVIRLRSAKIKNFRNIQKFAPNVIHIRFEELLQDAGQGSLAWLEDLSKSWKLQRKQPEFQLVKLNTKQGNKVFNASSYEDNLYYSTCLRGLSQSCCTRISVADATFIAEQVDRTLEAELEYVMPDIRKLCKGWPVPPNYSQQRAGVKENMY